MTRKEEILEAARAYVSSVTLSSPSDVIHFEKGAKWADEHPINVWHDASEEPEDNSHILIRYKYLGAMEFKSYHLNFQCDFTWPDLVVFLEIEGWAYIKDIIPKGGEK